MEEEETSACVKEMCLFPTIVFLYIFPTPVVFIQTQQGFFIEFGLGRFPPLVVIHPFPVFVDCLSITSLYTKPAHSRELLSTGSAEQTSEKEINY